MESSSRPGIDRGVTIEADGWSAEIAVRGAALAQVRRGRRDLLDGFSPDGPSSGARGHVLAPWTNRLRDGRYHFGGVEHQLAISDPDTGTALHGLVSDVPWDVVQQAADRVTLEHRLAATDGYPWELALTVTYALTPAGLTVSHTARNVSGTPAPYAVGAHPYVVAGTGPVDDWSIGLDADAVMLVDETRLLPTDVVDVASAGLDLRSPRPVGTLRLNHAFTGLRPDGRGRSEVTVSSPEGSVTVWGGEGCRWMQLYTGDFDPLTPRRSIAVEPMSAPADAFNSGRDLAVLAAAGRPGSSHRLVWGIETAEQRER